MGQLAYSDFEPRVGSVFVLEVADAPRIELELISAERLSQTSEDSPQSDRPFSLLFRGPIGLVMSQGIKSLVHSEMGALDLFLVPMQPDADGPLYEAVFA